jgi:hypothetical protein
VRVLRGGGRCQPRRLAVRRRAGAAGITRGCTSFGKCQRSYRGCQPARGAGGGVVHRGGRWQLWAVRRTGRWRCLGQGRRTYICNASTPALGPVDRRGEASVGVRPDDGGLPSGPKQGWAAAAQGVARGGAWRSRRLGAGAALERRGDLGNTRRQDRTQRRRWRAGWRDVAAQPGSSDAPYRLTQFEHVFLPKLEYKCTK